MKLLNEITFVTTEDGDALYFNGELFDYASKLYIYDLLVLLDLKGIAKTRQINHKIPKQEFIFPKKLEELSK